jgi:hypothetical protein
MCVAETREYTVLENKSNSSKLYKSKSHSRRNKVQFGEYLLLFSSQSFVFPSRKYKICETVPVVLYGCKTSYLTLSAKKFNSFKNRVMRTVFEPKWEEVIGDFSKLHDEDRHNFYFSPNNIRVMKSRRIRWAGNAERT